MSTCIIPRIVVHHFFKPFVFENNVLLGIVFVKISAQFCGNLTSDFFEIRI